MKRILILSDSLALPRETPELCNYEDTWPQLIKGDNKIHQVSIGGATSFDIVNQIYYHKFFKPDLVIIQIGIVDCAPRFLTKFEQELVNKIPLLKNRIKGLLNNEKVRNFRKISYVTANQYRLNIRKILKSFPDSEVWFLPIINATVEYEKLLPGITKQIELYNSVLEEETHNIIPIENVELDGLMSDHHHLNELGHQKVAEQINLIL